jgi:hypothetical protein
MLRGILSKRASLILFIALHFYLILLAGCLYLVFLNVKITQNGQHLYMTTHSLNLHLLYLKLIIQ